MLAPSLVTVPKASREVTGARQPIPGESAYNPFKPSRREGRILG